MRLAESTSDWPAGGFPGVRINPETLRPEIVDEDACAAALAASTLPCDLVFVRLVQGRASEAAELLAQARCGDPCAFRLRLLEADLLSAAGSFAGSAELYRQLLLETHGTPEEAAVLQHQGRSCFAAGRPAAAVESFARALDLRVALAEDAALIYASAVALQRARHVAEQAA